MKIVLHEHKITAGGVEADDKKVEAILKMTAPEDVSGGKRFCGVVQYVTKFLPGTNISLFLYKLVCCTTSR